MSRRIAILASGAGSTFEYLLERQKNGELRPQIVLLVTNNKNAGAIQVAEKHKIETQIIDFSKDSATSDEQLLKTLSDKNIDIVFLAGFLKKIGPLVLSAYRDRIFNSHPSLLPKYGGPGMYGRKVTEAVLQAREKETGVTIHQVNDEYDRGQIVLQESVPITANETADALEARVKAVEKNMILSFLNTL